MSKYENANRRADFANRPQGRIRRDTRRATRAAKRAWLEM